MPRGRLNETTVQRIAVDWLSSYYENKPEVCAVVSALEAGVSKNHKLGNGRADGLIVAELLDGTIFTASLEAKSKRTYRNISPRYLNEKWVLHALFFGLVMLVLVAVLGWILADHWFWKWIFPLMVFVISVVAYLILTFDNKHYRPIDVINQVKRYPANEQWIALSTDAYNLLLQDKQQSLLKDCRKEGIGLIRVSSERKVTLMEVPKSKNMPKGYSDFLSCYAKGRKMRNRLEAKRLNG